jgi:Flp pilus assembly protein TadD
MHFGQRTMAIVAVHAAVLLLLTGCAMQGAREAASSTSERATRTETVAGEPRPKTEGTAPIEAQPVADEVEPGASVIDEILAERRRGDYPEIEFLEGGFSITEQARIGSDTRSDYERALSLLRSERYDEGISILRTVIESTPEATAPYIDIGIAYGMVGETALAEQSLKTADLLSPANPVVQNELGILYRKTGRFGEARASYETALGIFEEFHFARRNLAVLCDLYLADLDCALRHYRAYLDSVGTDAEVEIWVADLENRLGNQGE